MVVLASTNEFNNDESKFQATSLPLQEVTHNLLVKKCEVIEQEKVILQSTIKQCQEKILYFEKQINLRDLQDQQIRLQTENLRHMHEMKVQSLESLNRSLEEKCRHAESRLQSILSDQQD